MVATKEILDFLTQVDETHHDKLDNLLLALEIADYVEELKQLTHRDFWVSINHKVSQLISEGRLRRRPTDRHRRRSQASHRGGGIVFR